MSRFLEHVLKALPPQSSSTRQSNSISQTVAESPVNSKKTIRLTRREAARWFQYLHQQLEHSHANELESLLDAVEQACWLARWMRESVVLDLSTSHIHGILATLEANDGGATCETHEILRDIRNQLTLCG